MKSSDLEYKLWLEKANEDDKTIALLLRQKEGSPSVGCFLCQQMAEKYLKALLVYLGGNFPKVHDLLDLETRLLVYLPEIRQLHQDLEKLNRYYIETRYPGDYPEFTWVELEEAYKSAQKVNKFITEEIKSGGEDGQYGK